MDRSGSSSFPGEELARDAAAGDAGIAGASTPSPSIALGPEFAASGVGFAMRRLRQGSSVYRDGDPFRSIYLVTQGSFKSLNGNSAQGERATGFVMSGEFFGMDGIERGAHQLRMVALEDSEVCAIPFRPLRESATRSAGLQRSLHRLLSQAITRGHESMLLLRVPSAKARIAGFLHDLAARQGNDSDGDASSFRLRMTRRDIGSFLGLSHETVSRVLQGFGSDGLIEIEGRHVRILDADGLHRVGECGSRRRSTAARRRASAGPARRG